MTISEIRALSSSFVFVRAQSGEYKCLECTTRQHNKRGGYDQARPGPQSETAHSNHAESVGLLAIAT